MLDFSKVVKQIQEVGIDAVREASYTEVLEQAGEAFDSAVLAGSGLNERLDGNAPWVLWPVAVPLEPFGHQLPVSKSPSKVTVVAVDGSQIMPSHHEVHNCYLLNVGLAVISYGSECTPTLESIPRLYHRPDDLYPLVDRRRVHIDELFVSLERYIFELETLSQNAVTAKERGMPVVAFYDGSLIPWSVDKMSPGYQETFLDRMQSCLEILKRSDIPLVGYISHSRSSELINLLRTFICPYEVSNCRELCGSLNEEEFPCSKIWPLTDRQLLFDRVDPGHRSSICLTSQMVSRALDPSHQICFSYINLGSEIARVELPRWLFQEKGLLELALGTLKTQVEKGRGYPVSLAEAHHLAVIKGKDREQFFQLITRHLVGLGVNRIGVSPKESRKRVGFV